MHVTKRGGRGLAIVSNNHDRERFRRLLYHMNDHYADDAWESDTARLGPFERPAHWPRKEPLVDLLAFTLLTNHFHILVRARSEGSVGKFIKRVTASMSKYHNAKYKTVGSLFQGSYTGRTVDEEKYLQYVAGYIMIKNTLELRPRVSNRNSDNFNEAWKWITECPWSSLGHYAQKTVMPEIEDAILKKIFPNYEELKKYGREYLAGRFDSPTYLQTTKDI